VRQNLIRTTVSQHIMTDHFIVTTDQENLTKYPPRCFINPKQIGHKKKENWIKKRLNEGLIIKLLYTKKPEKLIGYIEYIPGRFCWRAVDANEQMFIHCLWISPKKQRKQGYGSLLISECINDAKKQKMNGVAVVASSGAFMADKGIFEKNNFKIIEESKPYYLLLNQFKKDELPHFKDWKKQLESYQGLHIVYTDQCPLVSRFMDNTKKRLKELNVSITKLETAKDAQQAPSLYATFNLIYNGKLLADHYISERRFENIIKKEHK